MYFADRHVRAGSVGRECRQGGTALVRSGLCKCRPSPAEIVTELQGNPDGRGPLQVQVPRLDARWLAGRKCLVGRVSCSKRRQILGRMARVEPVFRSKVRP